MMSQRKAKAHSLWPEFVAWSNANDVHAEQNAWEDVKIWWDCFLSGANAGKEELIDSVDPPE